MKKYKGQVIVEFALILPLFLILLYGIIYSGMLFHDYSTLSNIARASAREAALNGEVSTDGSGRYYSVETHYNNQLNDLITNFYKVQDAENPIKVEQVNTDSVCSTIIMELNVSGHFVKMVLPPTFGVQYYMRKEP